MSQYLLIFIVLQALDLLTTVCCLSLGGREGNPILQAVMATSGPVSGLIVGKLIAIGLALGAAADGRALLLYRINCLYLAVVGWNLMGIAVAL